jgi:hypothetical protein
MNKHRVHGIEDAYKYVLQNSLEDIKDEAKVKNKRRLAYRKRVALAQTMLDWADDFGIKVGGDLIDEVRSYQGVEAWSKGWEY